MSLYQELKRRNVLRVGAAYVVFSWLVVQVAETLFPVYGLSDAAIRLVVAVLAVGFLPVLIFAWVFELTPEGLKKERDIDRSSSITPHTARRLDRVIMVVLGLALTIFAFDKFVLTPQREAARSAQQAAALEQVRSEAQSEARAEAESSVPDLGERSIAVLAFEDLSPEGDQEYLGDGLAEELLNLLAAIPELKVISRTSAFAYKGKDVNLMQVGEDLGVRHVLEGSVRKAGNVVRITAQLIDTRTDTHLWSKTYDRALDDLFAVQDDIAGTVVEQLKLTLLGDVPTTRKADPEAYALFLRARALRDRDNPEDLAQAEELLRRALAMDPAFARAWVALASTTDQQMRNGVGDLEEGLALQDTYLTRALELAPDLAEAYAGLGWLEWVWHNDLQAAASHYARAVSLDPSEADTAGLFLYTLGRVEESLPYFERAARADPVSATAHSNLGAALLNTGQTGRAIDELDTAIMLSPTRYQTHFLKGLALMLEGKPAEALAVFNEEPDETFRAHGQAIAHYDLGQMADYQEAFDRLVEREKDAYSSEIALVCAWIRDADCAFYWMEKEWAREGSSGWAHFPSNPHLERIADDPRWLPFLRKVGIAPEQLAAIRFEVAGPDEAPGAP
ncbi:MAG: tetratricopeptide repeat protein [Xanthomonadales bacterium]|jgi:TolB-like protein/Tfp pilus assembly protein PilF|nr:tetratricopeptide repeat protein [Xanthomonadales bacterium]